MFQEHVHIQKNVSELTILLLAGLAKYSLNTPKADFQVYLISIG